jgi:hypothetical protein
MPIEPGATYVFDLGYYDYAWWASLDAQACRIVTRFKRNTPLAVIEERPVAEDGVILSDRPFIRDVLAKVYWIGIVRPSRRPLCELLR